MLVKVYEKCMPPLSRHRTALDEHNARFGDRMILIAGAALMIAGEVHTRVMRGLSFVGQRSGAGFAHGVLASLPPVALVFLFGPVIARCISTAPTARHDINAS